MRDFRGRRVKNAEWKSKEIQSQHREENFNWKNWQREENIPKLFHISICFADQISAENFRESTDCLHFTTSLKQIRLPDMMIAKKNLHSDLSSIYEKTIERCFPNWWKINDISFQTLPDCYYFCRREKKYAKVSLFMNSVFSPSLEKYHQTLEKIQFLDETLWDFQKFTNICRWDCDIIFSSSSRNLNLDWYFKRARLFITQHSSYILSRRRGGKCVCL